jgi:formiminotetrahydrofolate cyclodeaminase
VDTKPKKPARNAETYLIKEDKRIYDDLVEITKLLKETFCGKWLSRSHCNALDRAAQAAYEKAEQEAELFWGWYEVRAVRKTKREGTEDRVGSFDTWYLCHDFRFGSN